MSLLVFNLMMTALGRPSTERRAAEPYPQRPVPAAGGAE
jgi:hypothetical protein